MGWLIFLALAVVVLLGLRVLGRLRGGEAMLALAAVFVAAAGYSWQGNPGLTGTPAQDKPQAGLRPDTFYMIERTRLLHVYGEAGQWLVFADGLTRAGEDRSAVTALKGAIVKLPHDVSLRIAFAHALFVLADGNVTPAVTLAFDRAAAIDPADPSARYFEGLAHFEQGDAAGAERIWRRILAGLPAGSPWNGLLQDRLRLIGMMRRGG